MEIIGVTAMVNAIAICITANAAKSGIAEGVSSNQNRVFADGGEKYE